MQNLRETWAAAEPAMPQPSTLIATQFDKQHVIHETLEVHLAVVQEGDVGSFSPLCIALSTYLRW